MAILASTRIRQTGEFSASTRIRQIRRRVAIAYPKRNRQNTLKTIVFWNKKMFLTLNFSKVYFLTDKLEIVYRLF
jgi:hypothetical protein